MIDTTNYVTLQQVLNIPVNKPITIQGNTAVVPSGYRLTSSRVGIAPAMDLSSTTLQAFDALAGKFFYDSQGLLTQGTIQDTSAVRVNNSVNINKGFLRQRTLVVVPQAGAVTVSDNSVTVPEGYIASSRTVSVGLADSVIVQNNSVVVFKGYTPASSTYIIPQAAATQLQDNIVITPSGYVSTQRTTSVGIYKSSQIYLPGTSSQVISQGYYLGGRQVILGDSNLVESNIASGVTIFGITGILHPEQSNSQEVDVTLGYINSIGAFQAVSFHGTEASDSGEPVSLPCYVWNIPADPREVRLYSAGSLISTAYSMQSVYMSNYESMQVRGGIADKCRVGAGASMDVTFGGKIDSTVVVIPPFYDGSGSVAVLNLSKGTATSTEVAGAKMYIYSGGTAIDTSIFQTQQTAVGAFARGSVTVSDGGLVSNISVGRQCRLLVYGGLASSVNMYNVYNVMQIASYGQAVSVSCISRNQLSVFSTGRVSDVYLGGSCYCFIDKDALGSKIVVNSGGSLRIFSGGTALKVTSNQGAEVIVNSGGSITYA